MGLFCPSFATCYPTKTRPRATSCVAVKNPGIPTRKNCALVNGWRKSFHWLDQTVAYTVRCFPTHYYDLAVISPKAHNPLFLLAFQACAPFPTCHQSRGFRSTKKPKPNKINHLPRGTFAAMYSGVRSKRETKRHRKPGARNRKRATKRKRLAKLAQHKAQ